MSRSLSLDKAYLLRLPLADYVRYAAAAGRRGDSIASYMRECLAVGARQLGGEKAVAAEQNKPLASPLPRREIRTALDARGVVPAAQGSSGVCTAQVGYGLRCRVCGKVHR